MASPATDKPPYTAADRARDDAELERLQAEAVLARKSVGNGLSRCLNVRLAEARNTSTEVAKEQCGACQEDGWGLHPACVFCNHLIDVWQYTGPGCDGGKEYNAMVQTLLPQERKLIAFVTEPWLNNACAKAEPHMNSLNIAMFALGAENK
jgi:hypothetical protein